MKIWINSPRSKIEFIVAIYHGERFKMSEIVWAVDSDSAENIALSRVQRQFPSVPREEFGTLARECE